MNDTTLQRLVREICESDMPIAEFNWLGGEPLLAGLDFYERALAYQRNFRRDGQTIINKIQTNGTLLDEGWMDFLATHEFSVGISLDGPPELHDVFRRDESGAGTAAIILERIPLLQKCGVKFGIISVINTVNVHYPDAVFRFFLQLGIKKLAFNHAKGLNKETGQPLSTTVESIDYGRFLCRVYDLWLENDDPTIEVRQIRSIVQALLGGRYRLCTFHNHCSNFLGVAYNGDIYPCEDHPGISRFCYGNIHDGLAVILTSPQREAFRTLIEEVKRPCLECEWWNVCRGGCSRDYYIYEAEKPHQNAMCTANRMMISHIARSLRSHGLRVMVGSQ